MENKVKISIHQGKKTQVIEVMSGTNLREALLSAGFSLYQGAFVQFNCRGFGVCGSCKVRRLERGQWWERRACQIRCFQNLEIQLE